MNKHLAYSFLYEDASDLKCDFEILSDEITTSMIGFLRSLIDDTDTKDELARINELYHQALFKLFLFPGPKIEQGSGRGGNTIYQQGLLGKMQRLPKTTL
jgi:hypothetical protein